MARDAHIQAVGFAGLAVQELENLLQTVRDQIDRVKAIGINAVGEQPSTESGQGAITALSLVGVAVAEAMDQCEQAKQHFNDYGLGL